MLNHRGSEPVVHPALQHSHCVTLAETPSPLWEKACFRAAGPGGLAFAGPGEAGSTNRLRQGERRLRTAGSGVGYLKGWEVPSPTLGSAMMGTVGGWWGQTPGVVDMVWSLPWPWWETRLD